MAAVFPLLFSGRRKNVHPETNHTMVWSLRKPQNIFLFLYGDHALWFRLIVMLLHLHELPWELPNKLDGSLISLWSGKAWKDNSPTINNSSICRIQPNFVYRKQLERLSRHAEEPHSSFIIHRLVALPQNGGTLRTFYYLRFLALLVLKFLIVLFCCDYKAYLWWSLQQFQKLSQNGSKTCRLDVVNTVFTWPELCDWEDNSPINILLQDALLGVKQVECQLWIQS